MNAFRLYHCAAGRLWWLALAALLMRPACAATATEEKFPVLQIGTRTYTNVTVTTKAKSYIFILHSAGMASIKVAELPLELQEQFGYVTPPANKTTTNAAAVWMKKEMARMDVPQVQSMRKQLQQWQAHPPERLAALVGLGAKPNYTVLGIVALGQVLFYLFYCYCCMLICRKAGHPPGVLVWLPVLQLLPLFRAAGMSRWWVAALFVPVLNFVPLILWPLKIAKARGKNVWLGILLLLPLTNLFAFFYLAFSDAGAGEEDEGPEPKVISFQTA